MKNRKFRQYQLKHLACADCANKIEKEVNDLAFISSAQLDFVTQRLKVQLESTIDNKVLNKEIKRIATNIENDVQVMEVTTEQEINQPESFHDHDHHNEKMAVSIIVISSILFVLPWIFKTSGGISFLLYSTAYLIAGRAVLKKAFLNILKGKVFDENFLMSIATLGAFMIGEYPEGVAVMLFYQIGEYFQGRAVNQSRRSIASLMDIRPDYAWLVTADGEKKVMPSEVEPGQHILVRPGEKIPLDGKVVSGISSVDTSALTGESMPRDVKNDSQVLSGFINQSGLLTIEVDKTYRESAVSKILELVQHSSSQKAKTERFITKFARFYTPIVVGIAIGIAVIPPILLSANIDEWIYRALIFLVISCPCALVISIPLGFFGGIGGASKKGILVKGGNYLEVLKEVDTIIFDKTGTLTQGVFKVEEIVAVEPFVREEILETMAMAEYYSNHPIAECIRNANRRVIDEKLIEEQYEIPGDGIRSIIAGREVLVGKKEFLEKEKIQPLEYTKPGTVVHISIDKKYAGYVVIKDQIKEDAADAIRRIREIGISRIVMLTGDREAIAGQIAKELQIDEYYANLMPEDKVIITEKIMEEKTSKGKTMVVGDGINDAPVLARADIGISMGGLGSDAAIEASDVVIMTDKPSSIVAAYKIAQKTHRIVWQNIIAALGVKGMVMALGVFGMASIWQAIFADVGVALLAIFNAMRMIRS